MTDPVSADPAPGNKEADSRKLGLLGLVGIVVGSMIGGGVFSLPQNMAAGAGVAAVAIAWVITGVGMYFLANSFRILADEKPELSAGIYAYARQGFGRLVGFEMAWGYWLSVIFGNVAFAVLLMQTLNYFWPIFGEGKNWPSVIGGSIVLWLMHFLVLRGVRQAAFVNLVATFAKIVPILLFILVVVVAANWNQLTFDIWGRAEGLGSLVDQIKSPMLVTLWVFIGIEGAVVVSGRARTPALVGTSTFLGFVICLMLYALVSLLPFGLMSQAEIAKLPAPSTAYVLEHIVGGWGAVVVTGGLLVSVLGSWVAWTILMAELPYRAAEDGVFPKLLARENENGTPAPALWLSSLLMQLTLFVVLFAQDAWIFLISVTGVMVLPPYLASTLYLWKLSCAADFQVVGISSRSAAIITAALGSLYAVWLLYAAGPTYLLMSVVIYAIGIPVFWWSRHDWTPDAKPFQNYDGLIAAALATVAVVAVYLFWSGAVAL